MVGTAVCLCWTAQQRKRLIQVHDLALVHGVCTFIHLFPRTAALFLSCVSFSNERLRCSSCPTHPLSPPGVLLIVSLDVGLIVMGAASWIIKHIFLSTIECDLAKWMWTMRAFPSYLYYLTRNGWTMDGQDRSMWATASSDIRYHHSVFLSLSPLS